MTFSQKYIFDGDMTDWLTVITSNKNRYQALTGNNESLMSLTIKYQSELFSELEKIPKAFNKKDRLICKWLFYFSDYLVIFIIKF